VGEYKEYIKKFLGAVRLTITPAPMDRLTCACLGFRQLSIQMYENKYCLPFLNPFTVDKGRYRSN